MTESQLKTDLKKLMYRIGRDARGSARALALSTTNQRNAALFGAAAAIRRSSEAIRTANREDMERANQRGLSAAMLDRLALDDSRIEGIATGLEEVAALDDPLGAVIAEWKRPNGLRIQRVRVPLGVIGIIYESRPNVTADAAALCLKSGNAAVLRGGSESYLSNRAIHRCIVEALEASSLPVAAVQLVPTRDREAVGHILKGLAGALDVVVPRGGRSLIERVQNDARVPVIGHLEGICHVYVHGSADPDMATAIVANAKMRRTGICGAAETLLIDQSIASSLLPRIVRELAGLGCELRGDAQARGICDGIGEAVEDDWSTEYLDAVLAIRVVEDLDAAIEHIGRYGSGHTEAIVAGDDSAAERFFREVDSAILLHNASTQFADGGEFGMGAEIGIATGKMHARGPVGVEQLTSFKYVVRGAGQTRPG